MRKTALFVGLTFLVNGSLALLFFGLGGRWHSPAGIAFGATYMFVPMSVAILLQKRVCRVSSCWPL